MIKKFSEIFGPLLIEGSKMECLSKSHKLFLDSSIIKVNDGLPILLPFAVRALRKLKALVRKEMDKISAQEILMPSLISDSLLQTSGRINLPDLFVLEKTNQKKYFLSATHEEEISNFMASMKHISESHLPCRFYQIGNKFRNEKRTKSGLLRSKEFIMKDLYCFDKDLEKTEETFKKVIASYNNLFQLLQVPHVVVSSNPGDIGGLYSNEFHFLCEAGEDKILLCQDCDFKQNCNNSTNQDNCFKCSSKNICITNGIEVGHAFNLGTTYSKPFNGTYINKMNERNLFYMSCFGLGLSRILAATVEVLSTLPMIRWPLAIAPYLVCVIPSKDKIILKSENLPEQVSISLNQCLPDEVVFFDKPAFSIGKCFYKAKKVGFPYVIIFGKDFKNDFSTVEIHDVHSNEMDLVQVPDINKFIMGKLLNQLDSEILVRKSYNI